MSFTHFYTLSTTPHHPTTHPPHHTAPISCSQPRASRIQGRRHNRSSQGFRVVAHHRSQTCEAPAHRFKHAIQQCIETTLSCGMARRGAQIQERTWVLLPPRSGTGPRLTRHAQDSVSTLSFLSANLCGRNSTSTQAFALFRDRILDRILCYFKLCRSCQRLIVHYELVLLARRTLPT